jgi:hypothetical protein
MAADPIPRHRHPHELPTAHISPCLSAGNISDRQLRLSLQRFPNAPDNSGEPIGGWKRTAGTGKSMSRLFLIVGLIALVIGLLWIGQGTGAIDWPRSSFMIRQIQWAGYGAALAALGLVLIWQSRR